MCNKTLESGHLLVQADTVTNIAMCNKTPESGHHWCNQTEGRQRADAGHTRGRHMGRHWAANIAMCNKTHAVWNGPSVHRASGTDKRVELRESQGRKVLTQDRCRGVVDEQSLPLAQLGFRSKLSTPTAT
jgi:hypothetical protein